jgi:polysaccharide export outer membrane protein
VTDVLRISVWKNEELDVVVPVRPDGKISFPLLDDLQAEGLEVMELKEILTRELSEFIIAPDVTVLVVEMNSQFVSILGAVKNNARIALTRDLRVLEAIATAGGFTTFADKDNIRIVRRGDDDGEHEYRFDYDAYIKGKAPGTNIVLQNGDTIIVPE